MIEIVLTCPGPRLPYHDRNSKPVSEIWNLFRIRIKFQNLSQKCSPVPLTSLFLDLFSQLNQDLFLDIFRFHYYLFKILKNFKKWMSHNLWLILRNISLYYHFHFENSSVFRHIEMQVFLSFEGTTDADDYRGRRLSRMENGPQGPDLVPSKEK